MTSELSLQEVAVGEFLMESEEILSRVSGNLALLEKGMSSQENLDELYRDIHTLKGTALLFGYGDIGNLSHTIETCLEPVRKKSLLPSPVFVDLLYQGVDLIEKLVRNISSKGSNPELSARLKIMIPKLVQLACTPISPQFLVSKEVLIQNKRIENLTPSEQNSLQVEMETFKMKTEPEVADTEKKSTENETASSEVGVTDTSIRVQVGLLDSLMNLIGEMVLVRNQVLQYSNKSEDLEFLNLSQRLDLVTTDLQDQVMKTRMQPIGNVVAKFQRVVRDLSKDLDKQIDLTIQGKDTELDKTLLEAIKDPLTHIVRNSCDHGIETPAERTKAGKPANGHLLISAFHEGGQVIVEISDDGKGLNRKKLLQKAIDKALITAEKAEQLQDRDVLNLIFLPGFSTATQVTSVSGRGVGMDVVRTNIEKIGGSVDLESVEGKGTTIRLRIPLTLAIVPAILVKSNSATYAIPQVKLVELVRIDQDEEQKEDKIQLLQGKPVYELRGKILPLVDLREVLNSASKEKGQDETINIVVLKAEGNLYGLIVDEVLDTADIVVKPLTKFLKSLDVFSAATILGTGEVALIIDPMGIAKAAELSNSEEKQEGAFGGLEDGQKARNSDSQEYLLFNTNGSGKYAMPLCMVSRLEELNRADLEYSGKQPIIQYRNAILPLIDVNQVLGFTTESTELSPTIPTIVVQKSGKSVGIVVNAILDVNTIDFMIDDSVKDRFGILGNLINGEEVITVIDVLGIIEREVSKFLGNSSDRKSDSAKNEKVNEFSKMKVLYAEDVAFFRKQVAKLLSAQGMEVYTAEDGEEAYSIISAPDAPNFGLILSDIEMPKLNGYGLAKKIRELEKYKDIPLVALTTRFSQKDIEEGMQSGFDCYLEKLNPDVLTESLSDLVKRKKSKGRAPA